MNSANHSPDITFTLDSQAFDTYRVTAHTMRGESFMEAHIQNSEAVDASNARQLTDKAERCGLAVRVE